MMHRAARNEATQQSRLPERLSVAAAGLTLTIGATAACGVESADALNAALKAPLPAAVRADELAVRVVEAQPDGSPRAYYATGERLTGGGQSWIVTAGHEVKGDATYRWDCNRAQMHIGSVAIEHANTAYAVGQDPKTSSDIALLTLKNPADTVKIPAMQVAAAASSAEEVDYTIGLANQTDAVTIGENIASYGNKFILMEPASKPHVAPGDSGGAVVNANGQVVGIVQGVTTYPLTAHQLDETYGKFPAGASGNYYAVVVTPVSETSLNGLSNAPTCALK